MPVFTRSPDDRASGTALSVPEIPADADNLASAVAYAEAGWYVLPVRRGTKNPGSIVGERWQNKSSRDPKVIAAWFAGTDHGIALHVGRSGAVVFDVDRPKNLPEVLAEACKSPSVPYQSTRPDEPGRGHYVFFASGRALGNGGGGLGKAWGEVRGLNGVIVVAPSVHPGGGEYRWRRAGTVSVLPAEIDVLLPDGEIGEDAATDAQVREFLATHRDTAVPEGWLGPVRKLEAGVGTNAVSRHDATQATLVWAMDEAAAGCYPARVAADAVEAVFLASVAVRRNAKDRTLTRAEAVSEFAGMRAWAVGQATAKTGAELTRIRAKAIRKTRQDNVISEPTESVYSDDDVPETTLADIDEGFWERDSLREIYDTALARQCSPWAVLGVCAARGLALVPPNVTLPDLIGPGSLNFYVALLGTSGNGKGAAMDVARGLVNAPIRLRNIGSGEGLLDSYVRPADKETGEPAGRHPSNMFVINEIDTMTALGQRSGSTLMPTLRNGFSGETLGFAYRSNATHIDAGTYRMTLVLGVQPGKAGPLLDDVHGGTPQRFIWFDTRDDRITEDPPPYATALTLPKATDWAYRRVVKIPDVAAKLIRSEQVRRNRGEADALDGHALFVREKFAYALAVLDGRFAEVTERDWELAGIAMAVSDRTRARAVAAVESARQEQAIEVGRELGQRRAAADDEQQYQQSVKRLRVEAKILGYLGAAGAAGATRRDIGQLFDSRTRGFALGVLGWLVSDERVVRSDGARSDSERYGLKEVTNGDADEDF